MPNHTGRRSHAHSLSSATIFDRQFSSSKSMHATDSYRPAEDLLFSSLAGLSLSLITELLSHTLLASSSPPAIALSRALGFLALSFSLFTSRCQSFSVLLFSLPSSLVGLYCSADTHSLSSHRFALFAVSVVNIDFFLFFPLLSCSIFTFYPTRGATHTTSRDSM